MIKTFSKQLPPSLQKKKKKNENVDRPFGRDINKLVSILFIFIYLFIYYNLMAW